MFDMTISAASSTGCVREHNEDMLLVGDRFVRDDKIEMQVSLDGVDRYLLALADGMGGHRSGDVASSEVLHNLQFFFSDIPAQISPGSLNEAICEWLSSINNIMDSRGHVDPACQGMGTTLVALAYYDGQFYTLNCGDSRLYLMHDGELQQLTTDHSLNSLMGKPEHCSIITNCIGGGCKNSYIDMVQCTGDLHLGDTVLICSDGLSDMLDDATLQRMLIEGCSADALCLAAEEAGGYDNVSVIVARMTAAGK